MKVNLNNGSLNEQRKTVEVIICGKEHIIEYENISQGIIKSIYDIESKETFETNYERGRLELIKLGGRYFLNDLSPTEDNYLPKRIYDFESETWFETEFQSGFLSLCEKNGYIFIEDISYIKVKRIYDFASKKWHSTQYDYLNIVTNIDGEVFIYDEKWPCARRVYDLKEKKWDNTLIYLN